MTRKHFYVLLVLAVVVWGCQKEIIEVMFRGFEQPAHFPAPVYHFNTNPITEKGFDLGRRLFYDTRLSADNTVSCASCHIQTSAFTHHGHTVSHGIFDRLGTRNAPPIMNLAWSTSFMWDGGIADLDLQSIAPITNHLEMGETMAGVLRKLSADDFYRAGFKSAFGSDSITTANFLRALSQFMLLCVSTHSKYDSVQRGQAAFHPQEKQGYDLVRSKCAPCHREPLFTDFSFRNNGIGRGPVNDSGRAVITERSADLYTFKVPSLRNLSFTAPYMHDGRFLNLDAVLDHYSERITAAANPDPILTQGIALTKIEKEAVRSFLKTLDDRSFVLDPRFAAP